MYMYVYIYIYIYTYIHTYVLLVVSLHLAVMPRAQAGGRTSWTKAQVLHIFGGIGIGIGIGNR